MSQTLLKQFTDIEKLRFWTTKLDDNDNLKDIKINQLHFCRFLSAGGFVRLEIAGTTTFAQIINGNILRQVPIHAMQDYAFDWVNDLDPDYLDYYALTADLLNNKIITGVSTYFNERKLHYLKPEKEIVMNRDSYHAKFLYYQNGFVEVRENGAELKPYTRLDGMIWENQILNRSINLKQSIKNKNVQNFLWYVSTGGDAALESRFFSLQTIAGYLLHDFYEYKLKLPLFTDSTVSEDNEANGRTGKTLFNRLLSRMIADRVDDGMSKIFVEMPMKEFNTNEKHKYGRIGHDTKLVVYNDLKRNFDMDILYNNIVDGILVQAMYQDPFMTMVKQAATTNKTVRIEGGSSRDRVVEFEFSDYFNENRTPEMVFKQWFFRDWSVSDWNDFDLTMIGCIRQFFANKCTIAAPAQINLNIRKLKEQTHPSFIDYVETEWKPIPEQKYYIKTHFDKFRDFEPELAEAKWFVQAKFTRWVQLYMNLTEQWKDYTKATNKGRDRDGAYFLFFKN